MTTLGCDAHDTLDQGIREGTAAHWADQRAAAKAQATARAVRGERSGLEGQAAVAKARRGPGVVRRVGRGAARVGAGAVRVGIGVLVAIAEVTAIGIGTGLGMPLAQSTHAAQARVANSTSTEVASS